MRQADALGPEAAVEGVVDAARCAAGLLLLDVQGLRQAGPDCDELEVTRRQVFEAVRWHDQRVSQGEGGNVAFQARRPASAATVTLC